ncbi:MAG: site-specific integrase [Planctomycetaceae bacterium]|nr:site-specific integrase [Planctomycetaceae bacterium]
MARFKNWLANEWKTDPRPEVDGDVYAVADLAQDYLDYACTYFVKDGKVTAHIHTVKMALQELVDLYGEKPAGELSPPDVAQYRDSLIKDASGKVRSLTTVNNRLHVVQKAYRWAVEKGLVTVEAWQGLLAVRRLKKGRSQAKDPKRVRPVAWEHVEATLKHCSPTLGAMIRLHWLTGMRPGEVCTIRPCDITFKEKYWLYIPQRHKCEHLDQARVVPLGPQAQEILAPWIKEDPEAYCFSPQESEQWRKETRRAERKTPLYPSHLKHLAAKRKAEPKRPAGDVFDAGSYRHAIHNAIDRANADLPADKQVPYWHPHQLRHSWATRIRQEFGVEATSAGLGHTNIDTTELYAERDIERAVEIALKSG